MRPGRRDIPFLVIIAVAGIAVWALYLAVQPHDYSRATSDPDYLRTIFGWEAPGIGRRDIYLPDRSWITLVGWSAIGAAGGWFRPRLWPLVGVAVVLPAWILYLPTAPRDIDGLWALGFIFLPVEAAGISFVAMATGALRGRTRGGRPRAL